MSGFYMGEIILRKVLLSLLALCLAFALTACGSKETAAPSNASVSAESETVTPTHEHIWNEANYQEPKTCADCGETDGEPFAAELESKINMFLGETYEYHSLAYTDSSKPVLAQVDITDYKIIASDETHEAKEGFEWRVVAFRVEYNDDNTWEYGAMSREAEFDFYTGEYIDFYTDTEANPDSDDDFFDVSYCGETFACRDMTTLIENAWNDRTYIWAYEKSYLVPIGYDGIVMAFRSAAHESDHEDFKTIDVAAVIADPNTLYFRLDNSMSIA